MDKLDVQTDVQLRDEADGQMERQTDERINEWIAGQTDGSTD